MFALEPGRAGYCLPTMFFLGRSAISNGVDSGHDAFNMLGRAIHSAAVQAIAVGNSLPYLAVMPKQTLPVSIPAHPVGLTIGPVHRFVFATNIFERPTGQKIGAVL